MLIRTIPTSFIAVATLALLAACEPADQQSGQEAASAGGDAATVAAPEATAMARGLPDAFGDVPATPQRDSHWTMRPPDCEPGPGPAHHRQLLSPGIRLSVVENPAGIFLVNRGGLPPAWSNVAFELQPGKPLKTDLDDCADGATILAHVLSEEIEHLHAAVDLTGEDENKHPHEVFVVARGVSEKDPRGEIFFVVVDEQAVGGEKGDKHEGTAHGAH